MNYIAGEEDAQRVADDIRQQGVKSLAHKADVSSEDEVRQMFRRMIEEFGTIDILVNNAGIQKDAPLIDMSLEYWKRVIDVNLTGYFLCAREAAREFIRRGVVPSALQRPARSSASVRYTRSSPGPATATTRRQKEASCF